MTGRSIRFAFFTTVLSMVAGLGADPPTQPSIPSGCSELSDSQAQIRQIMDLSEGLDRIPFREVIFASTGQQVLRFNARCGADQRVMKAIADACRALIDEIKNPEDPVHQIQRINEVSAQLENRIAIAIQNHPGLTCEAPLNAQGKAQRSGYPDLEIIDLQTGRVYYLDPKLHHRDSRSSSFRTFYYEAKTHTRKVNRDAVHLLLGITHGGRENGKWSVLSWSLVDLYDFEIGFKAEFQASNRDLYREETTLISE
jgi:hypothetical protein